MFVNRFCFLFSKTCFGEYKEKTIILYFLNKKHVWLVENSYQTYPQYLLGKDYFYQLILQFTLFLLLFIGPTALFDTIHRSHYSISANFNLYLQYFQQKNFSFSKISSSQMDHQSCKSMKRRNTLYLKPSPCVFF